MTRKSTALVVVAAMLLVAFHGMAASAQGRPDLAGRWTLNRALSQFPADIGFGMDLGAVSGGSDSASGGRGGGGGGAALTGYAFRESEDDSKRRELLVDEVRTPSPHLTIVQNETAVTITDEAGRSRTFHADGREDSQSLGQVPVATIARWEGNRLEIRYKVEQNREIRYTYSRALKPDRLIVEVQFVERGGHGTLTRVYEPTRAGEPAVGGAAAPPVRAPATPLSSAGAAPTTVPAAGAPPRSSQPANAPVGAQRPDAELKGISRLGVVVEDLNSQAAACGLSQAPIEAAVTKALTDAGFKVARNSDEDTYLYVQIITTRASTGLCVSRYDVSLYTHTTATLSYQSTPVLVQVSLLHAGSISGGAAASHGEAVVAGVMKYVDDFVARMRNANSSQ